MSGMRLAFHDLNNYNQLSLKKDEVSETEVRRGCKVLVPKF
jgi:hypothetical protein